VCAIATFSYASSFPPKSYRAPRARITREFKTLGYRFVTIDLEGYRTGSLNEAL